MTFAALLIATVQIARAGVVPNAVRRLPLIVLLVVTALHVVASAVALTAPAAAQEFTALFFIAPLARTAGTLILGIVALVLALRPEQPAPSEPVQVYPPIA